MEIRQGSEIELSCTESSRIQYNNYFEMSMLQVFIVFYLQLHFLMQQSISIDTIINVSTKEMVWLLFFGSNLWFS